MRNVEFFLLPEFVEQTLQRKAVSISTVLNFHRLSKLLSINDIVQVYEMQNLWSIVLNDPLAKITSSLYSEWKNTCQDAEDNRLLDQVCYLAGALEQTKDEVINRLINKGPCDQNTSKYHVVDLAPDLYGVVIRNGYSCVDGDQKCLLRDIVKAMGVYAPFNDVASSKFFDPYLRTLDR